MRGPDAPERHDRWWRSAPVRRELQLSPSQVQRLDALFERGLPERIALHHKLQEMDRLLERVLERGNGDDASVARLSEQVEALRAQENVRQTVLLFAMYRTLNDEQRAALTRLRGAATRSASPRRLEFPLGRD
jgi:Spy/CpxP family protein refolding chaperone